MIETLLVFLGAGFGGVLRHGVNIGCARWCAPEFPWGTMIINATGSLAMGLVAGLLAFKGGAAWTQHARLLVMTGVLGGYTTFSAFSLDAALLWERGASMSALLYVAGSVLLSIGGLVCGLQMIRSMT